MRHIFSEIAKGLGSVANVRQSKCTLRSTKVHVSKLLEVTADELVILRERLNMSRPVFAIYLRTNARTLENWEQGGAKPNAQAIALIRLLQKYPETLEHLAALA